MSRIGKQPVVLPSGVVASVEGLTLTVKGPKGTLVLTLPVGVSVRTAEEDGAAVLLVETTNTFQKAPALWGTTRANVANLVEGVSKGFSKSLEVVGVGYKAQVQGKKLVIAAGYSHDVPFELPDGVTATVEKSIITLTGANKHLVGESAAQIRSIRKPEPYKGKGIKYVDEVIRRKAGKAAKTGE